MATTTTTSTTRSPNITAPQQQQHPNQQRKQRGCRAPAGGVERAKGREARNAIKQGIYHGLMLDDGCGGGVEYNERQTREGDKIHQSPLCLSTQIPNIYPSQLPLCF